MHVASGTFGGHMITHHDQDVPTFEVVHLPQDTASHGGAVDEGTPLSKRWALLGHISRQALQGPQDLTWKQ
jgi:hypothetical protein